MLGQLGGGGGLARALESHQHDDREAGLAASLAQPVIAAGQDGGQLLVNDLYDLLAGAETLQHVASHGPLLDPVDQLPGDFEVDVGLQQCQADLAQSLVDILLGEPSPAGELLEHPVELVGQSFEHAHPPLIDSTVGPGRGQGGWENGE